MHVAGTFQPGVPQELRSRLRGWRRGNRRCLRIRRLGFVEMLLEFRPLFLISRRLKAKRTILLIVTQRRCWGFTHLRIFAGSEIGTGFVGTI